MPRGDGGDDSQRALALHPPVYSPGAKAPHLLRLHRSSSPTAYRLLSQAAPAFTLVELLVVIAIIVTVSAIVVPLLTPVLDSRRIRETARIVSTQFASAQSEAMAKGRPVGVWIERLGAADTTTNLDRSAAMDLYLCEVPQVYAGDTVNSRVQVAMQSGIAGFKFNTTSDFSWNQTDFLCPGDLIRFDFRGPYYEIVGASSASQPAEQHGCHAAAQCQQPKPTAAVPRPGE